MKLSIFFLVLKKLTFSYSSIHFKMAITCDTFMIHWFFSSELLARKHQFGDISSSRIISWKPRGSPSISSFSTEESPQSRTSFTKIEFLFSTVGLEEQYCRQDPWRAMYLFFHRVVWRKNNVLLINHPFLFFTNHPEYSGLEIYLKNIKFAIH